MAIPALRPRARSGLATRLATLLALLALGAAPIQVYRPQWRTPAEIAALASDLLGSAGVAVADPGGRAVVLRGPSESVERVLAALRQLDRRPEAYRIEYRRTRRAVLQRLGVELEGWLRAGQIQVAPLPEQAPAVSRLAIHSLLASGKESSDGTVAALEGRPSELWIGTAYPEIQRGTGPSGGETRTLDSAELLALEVGFRVTPRALAGGRVELEIAPLLALPSSPVPDLPHARDEIVRAGVSVRIAARPGRWLVVTSLARRGAAVALDPFASLDLRSGASDAALLLRAVRVPPPPPPAAPRRGSPSPAR
ncbi:MAG: secretin N-terminal domain-containing protein [Myxococcota bacterium]